jgi:hypothetical protein
MILNPIHIPEQQTAQFVKHLSRKHGITVRSINDWWKGGQMISMEKKIRKTITSP